MTTKKKPTNSPLDKILGQYAEKQRQVKSVDFSELGIMDFMVATSPHLQKPLHLAPVIPYFEALEKSPQFFCFSAPPRHGKSLLTNHAVARLMLRKPGVKIAYGCYSLDLSRDFFSKEVKDILTSNGFPVDRTQNSKEEWHLLNGSSFKAVAPGSGFTGRGADLIIVDDPYKDRASAESGKIREAAWNWVRDVCITRRSPTCSIVITHTRWAGEDVIGVLSRDHGIPFVNMPALGKITPEGLRVPDDDGEALWPNQWPRERLIKEVRPFLGAYGWASLYQGTPIPRGGAVFGEPTLYSADELETAKIAKYIIGIDCAYTKKSHADHSAAVVLAVDVEGIVYVVDIERRQCESAQFAEVLKQLRLKWNGAPIYWHVGGQEKAVAEYMRNTCGVPVKDIPAKEDKFVRSQAAAAAWNSGRLRIPEATTKWKSDFINEILIFTGLDDPHDDQVDALSSAFVPLSKPKVPRGLAQDWIVPF